MKEIVVESLNSVEKLNQQILEERARISTDRMDVSFGELVNMYKNGELTISVCFPIIMNERLHQQQFKL